MDWFKVLAPVIVGALIGFLPTFINETVKERKSRATRWDASLYTVVSEFVDSARRLRHLSERYDRAVDPGADAQALDDEHQRLRGLMQKIRILGTGEVQESARLVIHHAYSVRLVGEGKEDPHKDNPEYGGLKPRVRLARAQRDLFVAVRRQLGVKNAEDVPYDPHEERDRDRGAGPGGEPA
ncbi:hypothetical protein ACQP2P_33330 [Dactylosporangium sp. CA-139114]|uniref:hypothetical protein n=1 Tax=Dactylosporangium sp. CA-139114 TaxID=3239931 RepID=UPI003D97DE2C